jgi:glycosyltransferase involved in cell wall biosynthesis
MTEVLEQAAVLHDEFESDVWADSVRKVLSDTDHRSDLIARGTEQAKKYRWEKTARETWDVFRKVGS